MRIARGGAVFALALVAYIGVLCSPVPLFAHTTSDQTVVLHSRMRLPPVASDILADAKHRVMRSPLYRPSDRFDIYLCDSPALFGFFTLWNYRAGGVALWPLNGNIFLRPAHVDRDRLVGPSGREATGERTLAYFMAHEMTHTVVVRTVGRLTYARLEAWQNEGYADYVANAGAFDFDENLRALRAGAPELDPAQSGLYRRYHLLVAYLLDLRGMTPGALLAGPIAQSAIERELVSLGDRLPR